MHRLLELGGKVPNQCRIRIWINPGVYRPSGRMRYPFQRLWLVIQGRPSAVVVAQSGDLILWLRALDSQHSCLMENRGAHSGLIFRYELLQRRT